MNQIEQTPNGKDYFEPMHSAEHLINGAIARTLGCGRAFSTHIEKKKSKCDFRFHRNLTPEELTGIERTVNEQIASHADVRDEILTAAEAGCRKAQPPSASSISAISIAVRASGRTYRTRRRSRRSG